MTDYEEKKYVIEQFNRIIMETSGYDPGYYVDGGDNNNPCIFDKNGNARQSIACDSPIAVFKDLAKVLQEDF